MPRICSLETRVPPLSSYKTPPLLPSPPPDSSFPCCYCIYSGITHTKSIVYSSPFQNKKYAWIFHFQTPHLYASPNPYQASAISVRRTSCNRGSLSLVNHLIICNSENQRCADLTVLGSTFYEESPFMGVPVIWPKASSA